MISFGTNNISIKMQKSISYYPGNYKNDNVNNTFSPAKNTQNSALTSLKQLVDINHSKLLINKLSLSFTGKNNSYIAYDFGKFKAFYKTDKSNTVIDFENKFCTKLIFKEPLLLSDAIELIVKKSPLIQRSPNKSIVIEDKSKLLNIANEIKRSQFKDIMISELIGNGTGSTVFDIGNGKVLKLSGQNIFKRNYDERIDVPFTRGELPNKVYWCVQQKADTNNVSTDDLLDLMIAIEDAGYEVRDISDDSNGQAGWYNGQIRLIDTECAAIV